MKQHSHDEDVVYEAEDGEGVDDLASAIKKIKLLRSELSACQKERTEYLTGWQRAKADFLNAKKQEEEERKQFLQFAEKNLLLKLTPILESFDMAMSNQEAWQRVSKDWRMGVEYIYNQFLKTLEESGLKLFGEEGVRFDPALHLAVENVPVTTQNDDGKVVRVIQKGYELQGKVLKPARVSVGTFGM